MQKKSQIPQILMDAVSVPDGSLLGSVSVAFQGSVHTKGWMEGIGTVVLPGPEPGCD